jgi:hypothetical protein
MCFSITASLTTAAILIPSGIYCIKEAKQLDKPYWAFAMLPFMFGLQQLFEGGVWFSLLNDNAINARVFALGFLLFSQVFWLGWIAYSSSLVESSAPLKRVFRFFAVIGVIFGAFMYIPLLFDPKLLNISIVNHSIYYDLIFYSDTYVSQRILTIFYSALILLPLLLSSDRHHKILGVMVFLSGLLTWVFFQWVFVSVWCFFSSVVSLYIFYSIQRSVAAAHIPSVAR